MTQCNSRRMENILAWFDANPTRTFMLTKLPLAALGPMAKAGWIVGIASHPPLKTLLGWNTPSALPLRLRPHADGVAAVIRRNVSPAGRAPLPGVLLLDGGADEPFPITTEHFPENSEEAVCEFFWGITAAANEVGKSLTDAIRMLRRAADAA